jgi:hypothetical protein
MSKNIFFSAAMHHVDFSQLLYSTVSRACMTGSDTHPKSLDKWERAISSAHKALEMFRDAGIKRWIQLIDETNYSRSNDIPQVQVWSLVEFGGFRGICKVCAYYWKPRSIPRNLRFCMLPFLPHDRNLELVGRNSNLFYYEFYPNLVG